jgi:hypothetical protein
MLLASEIVGGGSIALAKDLNINGNTKMADEQMFRYVFLAGSTAEANPTSKVLGS